MSNCWLLSEAEASFTSTWLPVWPSRGYSYKCSSYEWGIHSNSYKYKHL